MRKLIIMNVSLIFFSLSLLAARPGLAGEPTEQARRRVDAVLEVLRDKEMKKPANENARRAKIRGIVDTIFDFPEMSQRSMGVNWRKRTADEKKEFISLYADLLEDTYIKKIEKYTDEKILYTGESVTGDKALVKTRVLTKKEQQIPIDYRLLKEGAEWKVYDVVVEGVSLVNNYRSQFSEILASNPYGELVKRLKNKTLKEPK